MKRVERPEGIVEGRGGSRNGGRRRPRGKKWEGERAGGSERVSIDRETESRGEVREACGGVSGGTETAGRKQHRR